MSDGSKLADEVAAHLAISTDSAYRRIRGEKFITLEELSVLASRYRVSLDALLQTDTNTISFVAQYIDPVSFRFEDYLLAVGRQVKYMASFRTRTLYYLCKDIPLFHHYHFKELAAFKYFFWHKTLLQSPDFATKKIALHQYPNEVFELGKAALATYNQINSIEIWNLESLNGTLRQVEFYHDTKAFQSKDDLWQVYDSLEKLFTHLETQAECGFKFNSNDAGKARLADFQMYVNEVVIGDNSLLAVLDNSLTAYLTHTGINFLATHDLKFCENLLSYYQNLMRKSTLISTVSERERSRFFKVLRNRIAARKENLGLYS